ncbi:hypothetical protein SUGI_0085390 [Cryptomeria japonica]|nr:hypothetical protein SUGI_0085390 [Cryptomeria japonica]
MESTLRFLSEKRQMSFLGPIKDKRWAKILESEDDLVNRSIRQVLGDEFIEYEHRYWVNTDILAVFISIILVTGSPKFSATLSRHALFCKEILGDLNLAMDNVDGELTTPYLEDYVVRRHLRRGSPTLQEILNFCKCGLDKRQPQVDIGGKTACSLKGMFCVLWSPGMVEAREGDEVVEIPQ